ncbi:hypothetical protein Pelo_279 [Pelomyxa schiedti]|nr:hypothetical protein Pelo_279 [Pelomyxa schiedti]
MVTPNGLWCGSVVLGLFPVLIARCYISTHRSALQRLPVTQPPSSTSSSSCQRCAEHDHQVAQRLRIARAVACPIPLPRALKTATSVLQLRADAMSRRAKREEIGWRRAAWLKCKAACILHCFNAQTLLGASMACAGLSLSLAAESAFESTAFVVRNGEHVSKLVTGGVFAMTRNPIYMGAVLVSLGVSFCSDSLLLLVLTSLWWFYMHNFVIPGEERALALTYNEEYLVYAATTHRWLLF